MKYAKSKNILIACTLSALLVQTIGSVYSPAAKPAKLAKPLAKPVAKPKLRTAPPVEITIPAGTTGIGTVALGGDKGIEDISAIFSNNFKNDLLTTGQTVTGTVTATNIAWKSTSGVTLNTGYLSGGTIEMFAFYTSPTDPSGSVNHTVTAGDTIKIVGIKAPPVTITIPANLQDISLGGNNIFVGHDLLLKALNNGETLVGTVVSDGTKDSSMMLTLKSTTSTTTATGSFGTNYYIAYFCTGDKDYTQSAILNFGTTVTIIGTKTPPPASPTNSTIFTLDTTTPPGFMNFTAFNLITATGESATPVGKIELLFDELNILRTSVIYGKCSNNGTTGANGSKVDFYDDPDRHNLLATFTSTKTIAWIAWTTNNKINADGKLNINIYSIAQQNGTFQLNNKVPPISHGYQINPFITLETQNTLTNKNIAFNFFSTFNKAVAISSQSTPSNQRKANLDKPAYFLQALSDYVSNAYDYIGNNNYAPLFNAPRYIYCKFSNNGATLQLYKDQTYKNEIGAFSLPSPQKGEYIYKLLIHTDAYISTNNINDPRIGSDGYVNFVLLFDENIALNNGSITIELINPNDNAYKTLSQITDFTGLAFSDTNNNKVVVDKVTTDRLNVIYNCKDNSAAATGKNCPLIWQATNDNNTPYDSTGWCNNYYSYGYNPLIAIDYYGAASQDILFYVYYNIMWVETCSPGIFYWGKTFTKYQEETRFENYLEKLTNLANISNITTNNLHSLQLLQAPITTQQRLFYFNHGYNPNGGPILSRPSGCNCSPFETDSECNNI